MKKEYATASASAATHTSDDATSTSQVADNDVTSAAGSKREATSDRDRDSNSDSDDDNAPPSDDETKDRDEEYYYGTLKKKPSQFQQLQQEEEQHPYMSLYEPLLFGTEPAEVQVYQSPSQQQQQQQQQQQPDETSSSSSYAVDEQSPPSTSATTATTFNRAKKRRKMTTAVAATKIDYSDNNAAENVVQFEVHKDDAIMNSNKRVAYIVTTLTDHDICTSNTGDDDDDDDDDASFDSSDDEAIIEHMKKSTTKKNKNRNSKPQSARAVTRDIRWKEMYQRLLAYKTEHKDTNVPRTYDKYLQLGRWVHTQRSTYKKNKVTEERKCLMNSIGFVWNAHLPGTVRSSATWEDMYQRLVAYKKEHNDTRVPRSNKKDPKLGAWVNTQRCFYKEKKMTEERKCLLNSIGFVWNALSPGTLRNTATWEEMYQRLVAYKTEHKDTRVPQNNKKDQKLGTWVNNQRSTYKNKKLTEERKRLLNSIGFAWVALSPGTSTATWEEMYHRLASYKIEHKDTNVPHSYKKDPQNNKKYPKLGRWVKTQRNTYRAKKMTEEHKYLLNSIGFAWVVLSPGTVRN